MSDLKTLLESLKKRSGYHRVQGLEALKKGQSDRAKRSFDAARAAITEAIEKAENLGVPDPQSTKPASEAEIMIAKELADCWGILGGVYRAEGLDSLSKGIEAYDKGYIYESSGRFHILSSYNRVNRLVVRILKDPGLLSVPPPVVEDINEPIKKTMPKLLSEADIEIEQQLRAGRPDREWALADLAMVRILGGLPEVKVQSALTDFDKSAENNLYPYDSMLKVIRELVDRNLPMQQLLIDTGERLRAKLPPNLRGEPLSPQSVTA